jgi:hypothetical protein
MATNFRDNSMDNEQEPIFEMSPKILIVYFSLTVAILFPMAAWYILTSPLGLNLILGAFFGLLILIFLYPLAKCHPMQSTTARFYEDHFVLSGWRGQHDFRYLEVQRVEEPKRGFLSPPRIEIYLKGENNPLLVIGNRTSRIPKTDLVSWLRAKLQAQG